MQTIQLAAISLFLWTFLQQSTLKAQNPAPPVPSQASPPQTATPNKSHENELDTVLMKSTFKIQGMGMPGQIPSLGVIFIIGRPLPNLPSNQPGLARFVLVTAAHVLDGMPGDVAILFLRKMNDRGDWERLPTPLQIRNNGHPLWVRHPAADVAVMYIGLPQGVSIPLLSTDFLADDAMLEKYEIHPGDTLQCLGFPFGEESNNAGFPILRSGRIASYPLVPTTKTKTFMLDFNVFQGNSGGPVYMVDEGRTYQGMVNLGGTTQLIAGLVIQETTHNEQVIGPYNAEVHRYPLGLATVVHASFIKEAINMLPPPESLPSDAKRSN